MILLCSLDHKDIKFMRGKQELFLSRSRRSKLVPKEIIFEYKTKIKKENGGAFTGPAARQRPKGSEDPQGQTVRASRTPTGRTALWRQVLAAP